MTMEDRIRAGMALLDKKKPGWREKIVCATLVLEDSEQCVLGQVYADEVETAWGSGFGRGMSELNINYPETFGFDVEGYEGYPELNAAWREALGCEEVM